MTPTTTPVTTLTLDVYADTPGDLRRRLRSREAQAAPQVVSLLPGGMILTESPEAVTYTLGAGGWSREDETSFRSPEGHVLTLRDGRLTLTLAK